MSATPLPDRRPGSRPAIALALAVATVLTAVASLAACGSDEATPRTIEVVVPAGTGERLLAGEDVEIMPARLELSVGDTLSIRNDDSVTHSVGPYEVEAHTTTRFRYGAPGHYEGYCPLSEGDRYEIVVSS